MENTIKPRLLKGFRDFLGPQMLQRRKVMQVFISVFEKYGYEPLETPALEYYDILMGKYGEQEKLVYNFEDFGGRKVALKYDLTVPASRVMAQYPNELTLPWKRYQMQPVWRADNTQKGRFREFWQCDADIFGSKSMLGDAEFITMGIEILEKLGFKDYKVRLNNRKLLNAFAEYLGRPDKFTDIVYVVDDWEKRPLEDNKQELSKRGLNETEINKLLELMQTQGNTDQEKLQNLGIILKDTEEGMSGANELIEILNLVNDTKLVYDSTIARGLSYYTGPVWEWTIIEGGIGSVGGCGRYDKLVGSFLGQDIPATGGSFGLERIMEVLSDRKMLTLEKTNIKVMVTVFNEAMEKASFETCKQLRATGINTLLYPGIKPLKKQFEYANKKEIPFVIVIGEDEAKDGTLTLKDMTKQEQTVLTLKEAIQILN